MYMNTNELRLNQQICYFVNIKKTFIEHDLVIFCFAGLCDIQNEFFN